jgi:cytochrome c peroxidase
MTEESARKEIETATVNGVLKKIKSLPANFTAASRRFAAVATFVGSSLFFSGTALAQTQTVPVNNNAPETEHAVVKPGAATDSAVSAQTLTIGDKMPDGSIYAGVSSANKPIYVTAEDAPMSMDFNEAAKYAKNLDAHGHQDWRLPTKAELNVLYQNRKKGALKGTFNLTGSHTPGWYWSSTPADSHRAWGQRFSDGSQYDCCRIVASSVRCVR